MARLAGVDLPRNKRMEIALTYIYGIGKALAREILKAADVSFDKRTDDLDDNETRRIRETIEQRQLKVEGDLRREVSMNIKRLMHTPGAKVAENHQNVRAAERFDLEVKVDLESDHNFYTGLTQNISSGGVFIATHHLRKIGDRITLKFTLPGSEKVLAVETEVRWIRENSALMRAENGTGMGVRFINLSAEASAAISAFVESRESLFYDDEE